ncbi:hypothetical protein B296_00025930 [Ensete ventricosum]|uniref:Uncharacterized protein n=1 Tax=Ensete ventricosum TaxID=4639 RepID=A0A426ZVE1_ENSVE|nr:hypothetical protein B296_00025930 [Ensete ventricosum]
MTKTTLLEAAPPPLNSTKMEILLQIKEKGLLRTPNTMKSPRELRDWTKYYRFHRDYGHDTEECHDLQNQIELIRKGHLGHYIDVIVEGPTSNGDSTSGQKAYARAVVEKRPSPIDKPRIAFEAGEAEYPTMTTRW